MIKNQFMVVIIIVLLAINLQAQTVKDNVAELISECYDLAYSGLKDEAKLKLVDAIHDKFYSDYEAQLRFSLGQICFFNEEYDGATYQWFTIAERYPNSEEAFIIKMILDLTDFSFSKYFNDICFYEEYDLSKIMWNPKRPSTKIYLKELNDPLLAVEYLNNMLGKYKDCNKQAIILYDLFLLYMGYNDNDFGYHNIYNSYASRSELPETPSFKYYEQEKKLIEDNAISIEDSNNSIVSVKHFLLKKAKNISDTLKTLPCASRYYVRTQFLMGVSLSGTKLFSQKIKLKKESAPFFENVVEATEGDPTNIYRIFAIKWLAILQEKD